MDFMHEHSILHISRSNVWDSVVMNDSTAYLIDTCLARPLLDHLEVELHLRIFHLNSPIS